MRRRTPTNLAIRTYRGERDIPIITALYNAAAPVDGPELGTTDEETRQAMTSPGARPKENGFLFEVDGHPVAYGRIQLEEGAGESVFHLRGIVHPDWRRRGIGRRVIKRLEQRAQARLGTVRNETVYVATVCNVAHKDRQALFTRTGYQPVRYFFDMERALREAGVPAELPNPVYPEGIVVRTMAEGADLASVFRAADESLRNEGGRTHTTLEQWQTWAGLPEYNPELWLIARDEDKDVVAGVCISGIESEHNQRVGRREGWVYSLAVSQPYHKRGLGRALLLDAMRALQRHGMDWAMLGVDTENLSSGLRIYEGAGFQSVRQYAAWRKVQRA